MKKDIKIFIEKHINKIIRKTSFENMKQDTEHCICYKQNKPCHNINKKQFNCFFCYCPEYIRDSPLGGCKIGSKEGKWFFGEKLQKGKIWDCSDCGFPHQEEEIKKYLRKVFGIDSI